MSKTNITIESSGKSLVLFYDLRTSDSIDYQLDKIRISWNSNGKLIKHPLVSSKISISNQNLSSTPYLHIHKVFKFYQNEILATKSKPENIIAFKFGTITKIDGEDYYKIKGRILGCSHDVYITATETLKPKYFEAGSWMNKISIFSKISKCISSDQKIIIGGNNSKAMPWDDFINLIKKFPTKTLLKKFEDLQIATLISNYMELNKDYHELYYETKRRIENKVSNNANNPKNIALIGDHLTNIYRFESLSNSYDKLKNSLDSARDQDERYWQDVIPSILPALYPQYIAVLREVEVPEKISNPHKKTPRYIDHLLVDASGNVDILEVKKPFDNKNLIMKGTYRDNYIPARELNGGISQIEKYIFYMNHLGSEGEDIFSNKCKEKLANDKVELPGNFKLKFLNPRGILLIGYPNFSSSQQRDFDIIRRQYPHIADILTYKDLCERINRILSLTIF